MEDFLLFCTERGKFRDQLFVYIFDIHVLAYLCNCIYSLNQVKKSLLVGIQIICLIVVVFLFIFYTQPIYV